MASLEPYPLALGAGVGVGVLAASALHVGLLCVEVGDRLQEVQRLPRQPPPAWTVAVLAPDGSPVQGIKGAGARLDARHGAGVGVGRIWGRCLTTAAGLLEL